MNTPLKHIAWFITPHGFGHAARAAAVMLALEKRTPCWFDIYTRVPEWFFRESLLTQFTYHECLTDIGLAQRTSLQEDLPETIFRLDQFYPLDDQVVSGLASELAALGCVLVVSDIAPLGLDAARAAGLPSILVENFTWDWIYAGYRETEPAFDRHIHLLRSYFESAGEHVQTEPVCFPNHAHFTTRPVSRPQNSGRAEIRAALSIPADSRVLLLTMGGIETSYDFLNRLEQMKDVVFIIPGGSKEMELRANLRLLPHHSGFYHPDLVSASDAVVGKLGYSTLAEAYTAGVPFGFIPRVRFRESQPLTEFVLTQMNGIKISEESYEDLSWLSQISGLVARPRMAPQGPNGADQLAHWMMKYLV